MSKKIKLTGQEAFEKHYGELFDLRWEKLKQALEGENVYAKIQWENQSEYFLDPASICAALTLPVSSAGKILDMCAAPGGKTLVLSACKKSDAVLYSNERSPERKARLVKVVTQTLPPEISSSVFTMCSDGALMCKKESESYDAILLDAPCSSERHVLADMKYLKEWTPSRIKTLSMEQWALISSAWRLLKENGFLLYATCALSPQENDMIIQRLAKKFPQAYIPSQQETDEVFSTNLSALEKILELPFTQEETASYIQKIFFSADKTQFGRHILPDKASGCGPLYFSLIKKLPEVN